MKRERKSFKEIIKTVLNKQRKVTIFKKLNRLRKTKVYRAVKKLFLALFACFVTIGIIASGIFIYFVYNYTDPELDTIFNNLSLDYATVIYANDSKGNPVEIEALYKDQNRVWVNGDKIPKYMKDAAIAIEDERYESHQGVDWKRTVGAIISYVFNKNDSYGGSTITQQLIRNITGENKVTIERKVKEIFRALYIERKYSKDEILEYYLNTVTFGTRCNGVQTASNIYFNKDVSELTIAQAASIIGVTNSPGLYDPFFNPDNNIKRAHIILTKMKQFDKISTEEYNKAMKEQLVFIVENKDKKRNSKQSYFVDQLISDVTNDLVKEKGYSESYAQNLIFTKGLKIYSTMDPVIQKVIDEVYGNAENFPSVHIGDVYPESAMVVMNPKTGDVVGLVGGRGVKQADRVLNRATQTVRQPGSCMKPIAAYAPAFEYNVISPGQSLIDGPVDVVKGWPKNYNGIYSGLISIRSAFEQSKNTIPVKILNMMGADRSYEFLTTKLGITSLVKKETRNGNVYSDITGALALGGITDGISVLELTAAFQIFPNNGIYNSPRTYSKVETVEGRVLLEKTSISRPAISPQTAYITHQFLYSAVQHGTGIYAKQSDMPNAGKTGTTSEDKDRWFVGYNPYYAAGIWFGYDQPKTLYNVNTNPCSKLFKITMEKIDKAKKLPWKDFEIPAGVVQAPYCINSGGIPTANCPLNHIDTVWFEIGKEPSILCNVHNPTVVEPTKAPTSSTTSSTTSSNNSSN